MTEAKLSELIERAEAEGARETGLKLTILPPSIGKLVSLERLSLRANWLGDLPAEFARLRPTGHCLSVGI
jgi:hypothetical protein